MDPALGVPRPDGGVTRLKWHRGRRRAGDPPFTGTRILEGMALGASVEVDLVLHRGGIAVLHDPTLDRATTGAGPVREADAGTLRGLSLRGEDGAPLPHPVMLLGDLCALIAREGAHPDARLQLDYKEGQPPDAADVAAFAAAVGPVAAHMILSSGDRASVARLAAAVPGLRVGHDPCHFGAAERLAESRDFGGFVAGALAEAPDAAMIY
jgi:glycerophosphoryl diester phosphodiesterase